MSFPLRGNPVKKNGKKSREVILASEDELDKVLRIASRNSKKYPNAVPDVLKLQTRLDEIHNLILNKVDTKRDISQDKEDKISEGDDISEEEIENDSNNPQKNKPRRKRELGTGFCAKCNIGISKQAKRCVDCESKNRIKFEITKDELERLILVERVSYRKIGKMYGVCDKTIRRRCETLGVQLRKPTKKIEISKDELQDLVTVQNKSYEEIGRMYSLCGNTIKKRCKSFNIELPPRRKTLKII